MKSYSKIETLFKRDENFNLTDIIRCAEFSNIKKWLVTEKIDGTNIRVIFNKDGLSIKGRTDNAQTPSFLLEAISGMFLIDKFITTFQGASEVCLYGEGYGSRVQKGGGNYNKGNSFRLFDVWVNGWYLEWDDVEQVARELGLLTVPVMMETDLETAIEMGKSLLSEVALEEGVYGTMAEGIVARPYPLMLFRNGQPIKFKLKAKDFIRKEVVKNE